MVVEVNAQRRLLPAQMGFGLLGLDGSRTQDPGPKYDGAHNAWWSSEAGL